MIDQCRRRSPRGSRLRRSLIVAGRSLSIVSHPSSDWRKRHRQATDSRRKARQSAPRRAQGALNLRTVPNQIVAEIDGSLSAGAGRRTGAASRPGTAAVAELSVDRRHHRPVPHHRSPLGRSPRAANFATETGVRSVQPNFRYVAAGTQAKGRVDRRRSGAIRAGKASLAGSAHAWPTGANVTIARDRFRNRRQASGIRGSIAASCDALGSKEGPHVHGTGVAGAIVAHARLMGSAPAARILAIRAFGVAQNGAESTSFVILKSLDYAASHGAQIINMSFAGPKDALIERGVAAMAAKGIVMVAAAGNAGAKSAAALSGRQSRRDRGQRHRRAGQVVFGIEPRRLCRRCGAGCRYLPAGAGR